MKTDRTKWEIRYYQAIGAMGYPVPGDITEEHSLKCGLCAYKEKENHELKAVKSSLENIIIKALKNHTT